jgi:hypothetical protein
VLVVLIETGYI